MATTTFRAAQAAADRTRLIRKIKRAVAYIAPMTVEIPEYLTDLATSQLVILPSEWKPVGIVTREGWKFAKDTEISEVDALGYAMPVREDLDKVTESVTVEALEYGRQHMLELMYGMDLSGVLQDAGGRIAFDEPAFPVAEHCRLLVIGADGPIDDEWILGKGYYNVTMPKPPEENWGSEVMKMPLEFKVKPDDATGSPCRRYIEGTGAKAAASVLGFTQAP